MYMLTDIALASCLNQVGLMLTGIFPPPLGADCVSTVLPLYICASPEDSIQVSGSVLSRRWFVLGRRWFDLGRRELVKMTSDLSCADFLTST